MLIPATAPAKRIAGVTVKPGCDFIGTGACQFPWPNDYFTKRDKTHRHRSPARARRSPSMPRNKSGKPIDPSDMNRADGFSPGNLSSSPTCRGSTTRKASGRPTFRRSIDLRAAYDDAASPWSSSTRVHVQAPAGLGRGRRQRRSTSDANKTDPSARGVNWDEGARYIVALRGLRDKEGKLLRGPARRSAPIATTSPRTLTATSSAGASAWSDIFRPPEPRGHRPRTTCTWPGTSRSRAREVAERPDAPDPRRRVRPKLGDTQPGPT